MISLRSLFRSFLFLDFSLFKNHPAQIFSTLIHSVLIFVLFFYVSKSLGPSPLVGSAYFPFVISGIIISQFYQMLCSYPASELREWQMLGLLPVLFSSPYSALTLFLSVGMVGALRSFLRLFLSVSVLILFFELSLPLLSLGWFLIALLFTLWITLFLSLLGTISTLYWKRINLVSFVSSLGLTLLSGAYFPISVLPNWIQSLSLCIPFTHLLNLFRFALFHQIHGISIELSLTVLILWALGLVILGYPIYKKMSASLIRSGTLFHY